MARNGTTPTKYPQNAIRKTRQKLHIRRNDLARLLQIKPQTLWRWETGKSWPTWDNLQRLAHALRTTPAELLPAMSRAITPDATPEGDAP